MKINTLIGVFLIIGVVAAFGSYVVGWMSTPTNNSLSEDGVACTMDAMMCPDGTSVGRTGPNCEFVCPPAPELTAEIEASIKEKSDLIQVTTPAPLAVIESPLTITGQARGQWFFEGDFPIILTNWDGLIIAEGFASANEEWMTTEFVPFTATLAFTSPFASSSPDFMERGMLILQKNNASGLPENADALEFPVRFVRGE